MASIRFKMEFKGDLKEYIEDMEGRLSPNHLLYMQRHIAAPVIHAAITYNVMVEAARRPVKWPPLRPTYKKIKESSSVSKYPMQQPIELGQYPTPWGNINVRTGRFFNTLGTILQITETSVTYGTTTPYASQIQEGQKDLTSMNIKYTREFGTKEKNIKYAKKFRKAVSVAPRPFDFISQLEYQSIVDTMTEYITAPRWRKVVLIPAIAQRIRAPGGRRIYIMGKNP